MAQKYPKRAKMQMAKINIFSNAFSGLPSAAKTWKERAKTQPAEIKIFARAFSGLPPAAETDRFRAPVADRFALT